MTDLPLYDLDGRQIGADEWWALHRDETRRLVAEHHTHGGLLIRTEWLGVDISRTIDGPPLIYATKVIGLDDETLHDAAYATREAALAGHNELRDWVSA